MAGTHRKPKPSPYTVAAGAVAYSLAVTFHRHIPSELVASLPAAVAVAANAFEHAVTVVDPKMEPKVAALATGAEKAIDAAVAAVGDGVKDAPQIATEVEAAVKPLVG